MYPTLMDPSDVDELERRRREIAELEALSSPYSAGFAPPMPAIERAELPPLQLDRGPDWTDALGVGLTAIGGIADVALNKGRGLGQIISAGGAYGAARAQGREQEMKQALDYEVKRGELSRQNAYQDYLLANMQQRGNQYAASNAHRERSADQRDQDLSIKKSREDRTQQNYEQENTPGSARQVALADWMVQQGFARDGELDGLTEEQIRAENSRIAQKFDLEHAPEKAAAVAEATEGSRIRVAEAMGRAGAQARHDVERESAANKRIGNAEIADPEIWGSQAQNSKAFNDANSIAQSRAVFKQAMDDMAQLQGTEGMQILPSGRKASYDTAQAAAIGSLTTLFQTGVINEQEYKRYRERIPASGLSAAGVVGKVTGENIVGDQIAGTRDELLKIFEKGLSQYGLRAPREGSADPGTGQQMPDASGMVGLPPGGFELSGGLGVTARPGVRNTPDFEGGAAGGRSADYQGPTKPPPKQRAAPSSSGGIRVKAPGGGTGVVTPEQWEKLKSQPGWERL